MRTSKSVIVFRGLIQILQIMDCPTLPILWFASLPRRFHLAKKKWCFSEQMGGWSFKGSRHEHVELGWGLNNRIIDTSQVVKELDVFEGRCIRTVESEDTHTAPYWSYLKVVGHINDHKWQSNCRFKVDVQSGLHWWSVCGIFKGSMNAHEVQPATVSDRTMQKFRMRTLNHSQIEECLLLWIDNEKLQDMFANHSADRPRWVRRIFGIMNSGFQSWLEGPGRRKVEKVKATRATTKSKWRPTWATQPHLQNNSFHSMTSLWGKKCPVRLLLAVVGLLWPFKPSILMAPEVLEIVEVNQTNENFCVIFTLVFTYVDPTLSWKLEIFFSPQQQKLLKGRPFIRRRL